jgi:hypothetical protein
VTLYALISWHQLFDLAAVVAVTSLGAYGWSRLRRKDQLRRVERKERQAQFKLAALRRQKEWDEAQRYFGAGAR